jgi:LmbE family N-acetylglucosaminyl deacetylase
MVNFNQSTSEIFIPDGVTQEKAFSRITHLAISAHQDDLEIMATQPILKCFQQKALWFGAVIMTDGRGSPRDGIYKNYTDDEMRIVRAKEQKKAAYIGEYSVQVLLDYPSTSVKDKLNKKPVEDLLSILKSSHPQYVYTHNLADKHDTHVATSLRLIQAIRLLPQDERPEKLFGCEVWRNLDWLADDEKVVFDLSDQENMQLALLGVFDSQICGGKRYDLASMGRRKANATYFESHGLDTSLGMTFGMDLTPLIQDNNESIHDFVQGYIERFCNDVVDRIGRFS